MKNSKNSKSRLLRSSTVFSITLILFMGMFFESLAFDSAVKANPVEKKKKVTIEGLAKVIK